MGNHLNVKPRTKSIILDQMELSLHDSAQHVDISVTYRHEPGDPYDTPPAGESIEILKAFLCNQKQQPIAELPSFITDCWADELAEQIRDTA